MTLEIDLYKRLTSRKTVENADYRFSTGRIPAEDMYTTCNG